MVPADVPDIGELIQVAPRPFPLDIFLPELRCQPLHWTFWIGVTAATCLSFASYRELE
jgi:hypothetical protein